MKKKTIDMYLSVKRDLEVKVELSENYPYSFVMANKETTLTCEVEGFPIDQNNLEWSFRYVLKYVICKYGCPWYPICLAFGVDRVGASWRGELIFENCTYLQILPHWGGSRVL